MDADTSHLAPPGAKPGKRPPPPRPLVRLKVGIVLANRFTLTAFSAFIDTLRLASDEDDRSRQILCSWTVMSATGGDRQQGRLRRRRPLPAAVRTAGRRSAEPKAAHCMASEHGLTNIAVLEKGWLGGGNTGRNTTIVRSNYLWEESQALYEHAMKLWEGLSHALDYNVMYSPRGVMMLAHNVHDVQVAMRHVHANRLAGIDNEWLTPEEAKAFCPLLNIGRDIRYPIMGAALQRRGGTARHDAVAWGYARASRPARRNKPRDDRRGGQDHH